MKLLFFLLILSQTAFSRHKSEWIIISPKTDASFRGLSVVNDSLAWVSGSKGWVGRSANGGRDWTFAQVKGYEKCDFRSLYAFDAKNAVIANAGSPAYILRTVDGGLNWNLVYTNKDSAAFFDGIDFWNEKEGLIYGDPIGGRMLLLRTNDGGKSWEALAETSRPVLQDKEASFAASGTAIRCLKNDKVVIATGGSISKLWVSEDKGNNWSPLNAPIIQGQSSRGIFSVAWAGKKNAVIVGGDYKIDTLKAHHVFYTRDAGKNWKAPKSPTGGYRECVEYITGKILIATGPGGTDISYDGGISWEAFAEKNSLHVIRKGRKGKLIVFAGANGKICLLKLK